VLTKNIDSDRLDHRKDVSTQTTRVLIVLKP